MAQPTLREMGQGDLGLFLRLAEVVGWGLTEADFGRMLGYEPRGCFVAGLGGEDVGMVATFLYGDVGWMGNLIVLPEHRGRGIGAALMGRGIRRLTDDGAASIRLDSVPRAIPLYRRLGFREEYPSLRFIGRAESHPYTGVEAMEEWELPEVLDLDGRFFGADRGRMLRRVRADHPDMCFTAREGGRLLGYIMAKEGASNVKIGPWICEPGQPERAEALLRALMDARAGEDLWAGVPGGNGASVGILERNGFWSIPPSLRMCYGRCDRGEDIRGVFGLGGPEKG
jgi:GNAT superfamily N-acetyltransferase